MDTELLKELQEIKKEINNLNKRLDNVSNKIMNEKKDDNIKTATTEIIKDVKNLGNQVNNKLENIPIRKTLKNKNIEINIGKNVMGVFASILIFIGIASFVGLIYNNLTETLKMILMYVFSFSMLGGGLYGIYKKKNGFTLSLLGCGCGAIYISLLLSHFHFKAFNEFILFGLMVLWSGVIILLSRKIKSDLFIIISYIGFLFALVLGSLSTYGQELFVQSVLLLLQSLFILLITKNKIKISEKYVSIFSILFLMGSGILGISAINSISYMFYNMSFLSILFDCLYCVSLLFLIIVNLSIIDFSIKKESKIAHVILIISCLANIILSNSVGCNIGFVGDSNSEYLPYFYNILKDPTIIVENFDVVTDVINIKTTNAYMGTCWIILIVISLIYFEIIKLKDKNKEARTISIYGLIGFLCVILCGDPKFEVLLSLFGTVCPSIIILIYSYKHQDKQVLNGSLLLYFIGLFFACHLHNMTFLVNFTNYNTIFTVLHLIYLFFAFFVVKKNYNLFSKKLYYLITTLSLLFLINIVGEYFSVILKDMEFSSVFGYEYNIEDYMNVDYECFSYKLGCDFTYILICSIMSIYTLFIHYSSFCLDWTTTNIFDRNKGLKRDVVYNFNKILRFIIMFICVILVDNINYCNPLRLFFILLSSILCFSGSKEILESNIIFNHYYVGLKATIFINTVIAAVVDTQMAYLYSIVCLFIAVIVILIGFRMELKSFRFYGLLLSIFSILKLLLVDIQYDNSLIRIFSFIGAGLLCFGIVWLYNKMSEDISKKDNTENIL